MDVDAFIRYAVNGSSWRPPDEWSATRAAGLRLVHDRPHAVYDIAAALVGASVDTLTFIDDILPFLPADRWVALVTRAISALAGDMDNPAAMSVVDRASFQAPATLHPYLAGVLTVGEYRGYGFDEAFHGATLADVRFLMGGAETAYDDLLVCRGLLATRLPEALRFVRAAYPDGFAYELAGVGFEQDGDMFRQLYPDRVLHLAFPLDQRDQLPAAVRQAVSMLQPLIHPTWAPLERGTGRYRVGGRGTTSCARCGIALDHLLTLSPVPRGMGVGDLAQLELATCLSCLAEEGALSYRHDEHGRPRDLPHPNPPASSIGRMDVSPLPETTVALADMGARRRWQAVGASNGRENLNRLGGHPSWVQYAAYHPCPVCNRTMRFLLQLDVDELNPDGLGYVLWCDDCKVSRVLTQQT